MADSANHRVVVFDADGHFKMAVPPPGVQTHALVTPGAVIFLQPQGDLMVVDTGGHCLQQFTAQGIWVRTIGRQGSLPGQFQRPTSVAQSLDGRLFVVDSGNHRVQVLDANGVFLQEFGGVGSEPGKFKMPYDLAIDPHGTQIAVADYGNHRVQILGLDGHFLRQFGRFGTGPGQFWGPSAVAYGADRRLFVADATNKRVQWFDSKTSEQGQFGAGGDGRGQFVQPHALTVDSRTGEILVVDHYLHRIQVFGLPAESGGLQALFVVMVVTLCIGLVVVGVLRLRPARNPLRRHAPWLEPSARRLFGLAHWRPQAAPWWVAAGASLYVALGLNTRLLQQFAAATEGGLALAALAAICVFSLNFIALTVLVPPRATKLAAGSLVCLAALISYFMARYKIYLDPGMLGNVLATNWREAREQFTPGFALHLLTWAGLPLLLLAWTRVRHAPEAGAGIRHRAVAALCVGLLALALLFSAREGLQAALRERPQMLQLANPVSGLWALGSALWTLKPGAAASLRPVGADVRMASATHRPRLLVLVIGESTRAANWGLSGYERDTTPELRATSAVNFKDVKSCGSNTLASVPCLFSAIGRGRYDEDAIRRSEGLLQVLKRAGLGVQWIGNQDSCIGVCRGLPTLLLPEQRRSQCANDICFDEQLLPELDSLVLHRASDQAASDTAADRVVVLHLNGSHGPGYFRRSPAKVQPYQPACQQDDLARCTPAEIRNAYDNSVRYTDHVLTLAIQLLQKSTSYDTALLFTSDHGESLGEDGVYMHGTPYAIAPVEQTHVPMVFWGSPAFVTQRKLDMDCIRRQADMTQSHDTVFHTVLGLLDLSTTAYDRTLDWSAPCRGH